MPVVSALEKLLYSLSFTQLSLWHHILNTLVHSDIVLIAPRVGSDRGIDITFTTESSGKGLASVTFREDIDGKFQLEYTPILIGTTVETSLRTEGRHPETQHFIVRLIYCLISLLRYNCLILIS